jgi:hypothetical protein
VPHFFDKFRWFMWHVPLFTLPGPEKRWNSRVFSRIRTDITVPLGKSAVSEVLGHRCGLQTRCCRIRAVAAGARAPRLGRERCPASAAVLSRYRRPPERFWHRYNGFKSSISQMLPAVPGRCISRNLLTIHALRPLPQVIWVKIRGPSRVRTGVFFRQIGRRWRSDAQGQRKQRPV